MPHPRGHLPQRITDLLRPDGPKTHVHCPVVRQPGASGSASFNVPMLSERGRAAGSLPGTLSERQTPYLCPHHSHLCIHPSSGSEPQPQATSISPPPLPHQGRWHTICPRGRDLGLLPIPARCPLCPSQPQRSVPMERQPGAPGASGCAWVLQGPREAETTEQRSRGSCASPRLARTPLHAGGTCDEPPLASGGVSTLCLWLAACLQDAPAVPGAGPESLLKPSRRRTKMVSSPAERVAAQRETRETAASPGCSAHPWQPPAERHGMLRLEAVGVCLPQRLGEVASSNQLPCPSGSPLAATAGCPRRSLQAFPSHPH